MATISKGLVRTPSVHAIGEKIQRLANGPILRPLTAGRDGGKRAARAMALPR